MADLPEPFGERGLDGEEPNVDPDPFSIGLGLITVLAAAGGYLEPADGGGSMSSRSAPSSEPLGFAHGAA